MTPYVVRTTLDGVIKSFRDKVTLAVYRGVLVRRLPRDIQQRALDKLRMLDAAERLEDLQVPPSNRLETLKGDRAGQWSIRINDRWRICFHWESGHAHEVEIVDYH